MSEQTISCPSCHAPNALPAEGNRCQFCGSELLPAAVKAPASFEEPFDLETPGVEPPVVKPQVPLDEFEILDLPEAVAVPEPPVVPVLKAVRTAGRSGSTTRTAADPSEDHRTADADRPGSRRETGSRRGEAEDFLGTRGAGGRHSRVRSWAVGDCLRRVGRVQNGSEAAADGGNEPKRDSKSTRAKPSDRSPTAPNPGEAGALKPDDVASQKPAPQPSTPPVKGGTDVEPKKEPPKTDRVRVPNFVPVDVLRLNTAEFEDKTEIALPDAATMACTGGNGRFWVLWIAKLKQIAILDFQQLKVVKTIPMASSDVQFAAGMTRLIVADNGSGKIVRYNLEKLVKEAETPNPFPGHVLHLCMGSGSEGPLFVANASGAGQRSAVQTTFVDPMTMKTVEYQGATDWPKMLITDVYHFRANPSGTLFAACCRSRGESLNVCAIEGGRLKTSTGPTAGIANPTDDRVIVASGGLYDVNAKFTSAEGKKQKIQTRVPAATGRFYLTRPDGDKEPTALYLIGRNEPILANTGLDLPVSNEAATASALIETDTSTSCRKPNSSRFSTLQIRPSSSENSTRLPR